MKKIFGIISLLVVLTLPMFAQLTPSDSTITGNITGTVKLDSLKVYKLSGFVYVQNGGKLYIPGGTVILGETSTQGSLIIERGGQIFATGTPQKPVVFTSEQPAGSRARGDWGGLVICGIAENNRTPKYFTVEGNIGSLAGYGDASFPTKDDNDNSGVLTYVRIEFPGIAFTPNNEINGLTLGAVGKGTTIHHVMVSYSGDDSFEFFGGTVDAKYLIAYKAWDDDFDTDFGYSGRIQFGVSYRDPQMADVSRSEAFESDNDGTGTTAAPRTSPIFSNITAIGPKRLSTDTDIHSDFYYAVHHRRSTRMSIFNSVFTGYKDGGVYFQATADDSSNFKYRFNTFAGFSTAVTNPVMGNYWTNGQNTTVAEVSDLLLKAPFNQINPVLVPQTGSPLLNAASFTDPSVNDGWFTSVTYRGAFSGNGNDRWDLGWADYDPQGIVYNNSNLTTSSLIYLTAGGVTRQVVIGQGTGATDGVDALFGEQILPPTPPSGVLDLRILLPDFTSQTSIDIRSNATTSSPVEYYLQIQNGSGTHVLNWDPNKLGAGSYSLIDPAGPTTLVADMKAVSSYTLNGEATLQINVNTRLSSQTYTLVKNWNLLSVPGNHPTSNAPATYFPAISGGYNTYTWDGVAGNYSIETSLTPGAAYWVHMSNATNYTFSGGTALNAVKNMPIDAATGWNMIGAYEYTVATSNLRTNPSNAITGSIYKYENGYVAVTSLIPRIGYWINLTQAANIFLPATSFTGTFAKESENIVSSDWGRIIITDASGKKYVLYSAESSDNWNMYNLPPVPPAGMFDIRFGSQRFVENLSKTQTIQLNGVQYPITIKADGIALNLEDAVKGSMVNARINNGETFTLNNKDINILKVSSQDITPTAYKLSQNYPNPFNPSTTINFSIPEKGNVKLAIYNALGQKVAELVNNTLEAGSYSFNWNAKGFASGLYFYELTAKDFSSTKKMVLIK